jgi:hypothetical protein
MAGAFLTGGSAALIAAFTAIPLPGAETVLHPQGRSAAEDGAGQLFLLRDAELVEIAGGIDIFADRTSQGAAKDRVVTIEEVVAREPDLIIGSWCGKKFRPERVMSRPGFDQTPAVQHQDLYEIKSPLILQPGPAALTDGLAELRKIIRGWAGLPI